MFQHLPNSGYHTHKLLLPDSYSVNPLRKGVPNGSKGKGQRLPGASPPGRSEGDEEVEEALDASRDRFQGEGPRRARPEDLVGDDQRRPTCRARWWMAMSSRGPSAAGTASSGPRARG